MSQRKRVIAALSVLLGLMACSTGLRPHGTAVARVPGADPGPALHLPEGAPSVSQHFRRFSGAASQSDPTLKEHLGIDIIAPKGTAVLAALDGRVVQSGYHGLFGNQVILQHAPLPDGRAVFTVYKHLSRRNVSKGERISRGQMLGGLGRSGMVSSGILHLHFEVLAGEGYKAEPLDPNLFWMNGAGRVTCFTPGRIYDGAGLRLTYPVICKQ